MSLRRLMVVSVVVFFTTEAVSGEDVMKAVGDQVSFRPDKPLPPSVSSIIWKHRRGTDVIKAIEWDVEDGFKTPNLRFKDITTLDKETGQITITQLNFNHIGVYSIDLNSKEQEQRFTLTVKERVPRPVIELEKTSNPDVVYLTCKYNEMIIWKNSAGETLKGSPISPIGESITVEKNGNLENFYTCTLDNGVSQETSAPVYERDLFKERVPKPVIELEKIKNNPDVVYLTCKYNEPIIWKNSAGETLKGSPISPIGESITVEKNGNLENFYTCTLDNGASQETSAPVYERDLFKERVPRPVIELEKTSNPDVVYLTCKYNEPIIWKNSAGETLKGLALHPIGEAITVEKNGDPENFYTCTLDNGVSQETSDPVYERDLFKEISAVSV
ncbi:uncharacterized protein [Pseudorasbora parva]|uniref:uncharacterized protein isoform X2 n=1 Tax=Pseudorasbora parva TaxID=51549 RepID=UPI00351F471F